MSSSFMTYLAFYIIIIHDALNLLYHHRSSSLSLSSQVLSYVCISTLYWGNVCFATPPYLCCQTSLSSSFMTCSAIYIIFIHDVLNLLYHHRSSSLSLLSQVSSYVCISTLYWQCVFNVTTLYLCCHTYYSGLRYCYHHS